MILREQNSRDASEMPAADCDARDIDRDPQHGEMVISRCCFIRSLGLLARLGPVLLCGLKAFVSFQFYDVNPQWNV